MSIVKSRRRRVVAACAIAAAGLAGLAGCASPYGEASGHGGYHTDRLDATHWRVQYDGNGNTPREQVWAYWIYRCAEITRQNGYTYFEMLPATWTPPPAPAASAAPVAWRATPDDAGLTRRAVWTPGDGVRFVQTHGGGSAPHYVYVPGGSYNITTWHTKAVVAMFNAPVSPEAALVVNAQTVLDDLAPYVMGHDKHPMDREQLVAHSLRWVDATGDVQPLMTPPAAAASAPMRYAPRTVAPSGRQELAS